MMSVVLFNANCPLGGRKNRAVALFVHSFVFFNWDTVYLITARLKARESFRK